MARCEAFRLDGSGGRGWWAVIMSATNETAAPGSAAHDLDQPHEHGNAGSIEAQAAIWAQRHEPIYRRYDQGRHGRDALARTVLPRPNPSDTQEQVTRFEHRDLALMDARELWQECERAKLALILSDVPDPWALERFHACQAEQAARQKRGAS